MPREDGKHREDALFERLYDALGEEGVEDLAAKRASLAEQGIDIDATIAMGMRLFEQFSGRQRLVRARARFERIQKAVDDFVEGATGSLEVAREEIARTLSSGTSGVTYLVYHRKLQSIEPDDLKSLKDDATLLTFIERLQTSESQE